MSLIGPTFSNLKARNRKALIPFITAGDPAPADTVPLMHALVSGGADLLELGVPFSDPMADGPTIQRASERALKHHVGLRDVLGMVADFRRTDATTPVVLMGYANPPEESAEFAARCAAAGLDNIYLLAPTTPEARVADVAQHARGFIYYVSLKGVTGAATLDMSEVAARLPAIRAATGLPVGVGFGIRDAATARHVAEVADAVVIGSRIVQEIEQSTPENMLANVKNFVAGIRSALDR